MAQKPPNIIRHRNFGWGFIATTIFDAWWRAEPRSHFLVIFMWLEKNRPLSLGLRV